MLLPEIEPFADHHIDKLKEIRTDLDVMLATDLTLTPEAAEAWQKTLKDAERALYRFRQCAVDEWKMKERLEIRVRTCRLEHRDK